MQTAETKKVHTTREQIQRLFRNLRKVGLFARMSYWCCSSCGWCAAAHEVKPEQRGIVFFHQQDAEALSGHQLCGKIYLAFGSNDENCKDPMPAAEVAATITMEAAKLGIPFEWNGSETTRVALLPYYGYRR